MKLVRLTDKEYKKIENKRICLVEKSISYLTELTAFYNIFDRLAYIVDDNPRNIGVFKYNQHKIEVSSLTKISELNLQDTIIIITSDYYREYYDKICGLLENCDAEIYFFPNQETAYEFEYRDQYADAQLQDILVFRSGPHASGYVKGMDFADNARALFEFALSIGLNEKYELVWIVKNSEEFPRYKVYTNVSFLPFDGSVSENKLVRDEYYRVMCLAKFIFFTDAYGFARNCREDQTRVQLWHGCGFKKRLSCLSCSLRYEYMPVTSDLYAKLHAKEFGLRNDQMLVTGIPKTDWLFLQDKSILRKLGIKEASKYIFWMPTYRFSEKKMNKPIDGALYEETGLPMIRNQEELKELNRALSDKDMVLVIKLHPFQDKSAVQIEMLSNIVLLDNEELQRLDIQMNQVLGLADALISDYSSTAVDFLILNRPMAFLVEDAGSYSDNRGYIFDDILDALPGVLIEDMDGIEKFIKEIALGIDSEKSKREKLLDEYHCHKDNNSCRRLLKHLGIIKY